MSRLVVPRDLRCFSTCGLAGQSAPDCHESTPSTGKKKCWHVPEDWKACATCGKLPEAEVVIVPNEPK